MAEVRYQLGEGPSARTALSLSRHTTEVRVYRARTRLLSALHEHGLIDDDLEDPDG